MSTRQKLFSKNIPARETQTSLYLRLGSLAMMLRLALLVAHFALGYGVALNDFPPTLWPPPIHRYITFHTGGTTCTTGTRTQLLDSGEWSSYWGLNLISLSSSWSCDQVNQGLYGTLATAAMTASSVTPSGGSPSFSYVLTSNFVSAAGTGTYAGLFQFTPLGSGPGVQYSIDFIPAPANLIATVIVRYPACPGGVSFFGPFSAGVAGRQIQLVVIFDAENGVRVFINGVQMLHQFDAFSQTTPLTNCRYGIRNVWSTQPGTLTLLSGATTAHVLQDIQFYNYAIRNDQIKNLLPPVVSVQTPPPPPATGATSMPPALFNANAANAFNARTWILSHRYLGSTSSDKPITDNVLIDLVGRDNRFSHGVYDGTALGNFLHGGNSYYLGATNVEFGMMEFNDGLAEFTIRALISVLISLHSLTFQYHNTVITLTPTSITITNSLTGAAVSRTLAAWPMSTFATASFTPAVAMQYFTIVVSTQGTRVYMGDILVATFTILTAGNYNNGGTHKAPAGIFACPLATCIAPVSGHHSFYLYDLQYYDVALSASDIVALAQGADM